MWRACNQVVSFSVTKFLKRKLLQQTRFHFGSIIRKTQLLSLSKINHFLQFLSFFYFSHFLHFLIFFLSLSHTHLSHFGGITFFSPEKSLIIGRLSISKTETFRLFFQILFSQKPQIESFIFCNKIHLGISFKIIWSRAEKKFCILLLKCNENVIDENENE